MSNQERGPASSELADILHDLFLCLDVESTGGFIEYEYLRIGQDGPCYGDALALAAGEAAASFTYVGVVAMRHLLNEFMGAGELSGPLYFLMASIWQRGADVFLNGASEEQAILQDGTDLAAQPSRLGLGDVDTIDEYPPLLRQVEALDEFRERALAGPRAADDADGEPGRYNEIHVLDDAAAVITVGKGNITELDLTSDIWQRSAIGIPVGLLVALHEITESAHRYASLLEFLPGVNHAHDGSYELAGDHLESNERADGESRVHDLDCTDPENQERVELLEEQADGSRDGLELHDRESGLDQATQEFFVALDESGLDSGILDRLDTGDRFNQERTVRRADEEAAVE